MVMGDEVASITHHESGHAVAALMTAHGDIGSHIALRLVGDRGGGTSHIRASTVQFPAQAAFIYFAGPLAEARVKWGKPVHTLDDTNEHGLVFGQVVDAAFSDGSDYGGGSDRARFDSLATVEPTIADQLPYWVCELERAWPVITRLANALTERLRQAEPDTETWAAVGKIEREARMSNAEIVALVQPPLEASGMWRYLGATRAQS
ncbi:hypothetical protein PDG61_21005 [Mycolicibacterium sp. BiH015]|uniref:hypothetical protein n=1 Tax=Mycolicibacterium sp. BiH015 TaxID=3018808 RepID=UPI0022DF4315|nr:hypothetical protein [Mycolicibacterium sp. BiH015]MDA2893407.1 hypothetical protein [Mycolicibacterium sp. BiH015]